MPNGLASCFTDSAGLSFAADSEKILVSGWSLLIHPVSIEMTKKRMVATSAWLNVIVNKAGLTTVTVKPGTIVKSS